ncbi:hypothetical protein BDV09DRAFT_195305 [Aspergillus tetrazonus]
MAAIADLLERCFSQITLIINSDALLDHEKEVPPQEWRDELGRLRVWAANIGAHQTRQSSLDYRLRDASHIRSQIVRLLNHIQELLTDLEDILDEDSDDGSQDDKLEGLSDLSGNESATEIQEIHQSLVETITQLYQMSMIIRNPAQHDRLVGTNKLDSEPFQFWAKQHTSTKYPNADALAIDRISSAMARQRAFFKYRERHHAKLSLGIDPQDDGKSATLSETVAAGVFRETPDQFNDMISDAGASETSYGSTLLEGTSEDAPKIPPIPKKGAEQRPFECPYCFYIITVRDKRAWTRHIFRDLMPYVCIFPGCSTPNKLYEGRRQWYRHIQQTHTSRFSGNGTYDCSICRQDSLPNTTFRRHVGQHLEELALFLLPPIDSEEDETTVPDEEDDTSTAEIEEETNEKGRCPHPDCGRVFRDLKAHMLTHQSERPEKCPIVTCEYHTRGFARKYDKNRHTLTHYKGIMVCGFCPGSRSLAEKSFNRADMFKRHLTSVHGVEQTPSNCQKRSPGASANKAAPTYPHDATSKCSTCSHMFSNAQDFYEHLDDCVL